MHRPGVVFLGAHQLRTVLAVAVAVGLIGLAIARVPLPSTSDPLDGSYVHAVGYFIEPLLIVPVVGLALIGDAAELERHTGRRLLMHRVVLVFLLTIVPIICLLPSAATHPAPQPVRVMIENVFFVTGEACGLATLLSARWLWAPIMAIALVGVMGPDQGVLSNLVGVNRTASWGDLLAASAVLLSGGALYLWLWPEPRLARWAAGRCRTGARTRS